MASKGINKVILVGNLGQDPEVRYTPGGATITNISVATSESWKDKNSGQMQEKTEWHRVVFFGKLAEIAGEYLKKGSQVYVEGKLTTRKWQDKQGQDKYTTEVVVDSFSGVMQMLGGKQEGGQSNQGGQSNNSQTASQQGYPIPQAQQAQQQAPQNQMNQQQAPQQSYQNQPNPKQQQQPAGDFDNNFDPDDIPF